MSVPTISQQARHLTAADIEQFHERGFVKNLPLLDVAGVEAL